MERLIHVFRFVSLFTGRFTVARNGLNSENELEESHDPLCICICQICVYLSIYIYMYCVCDITRRESYLMVIDPDHSSANSSPDDRRSASAVVNNPSHHLVYICYVTGLDGAIFLNRFETHRQNFILGCYLKARRPPTMGVRTRLRVLPFPKFVHHQDEYILQFYLVIFFLWAWKLIYSM